MIACAWVSHVHNIFHMSTSGQAAHANCGPDAAERSAALVALEGPREMQALSASVFRPTRTRVWELLLTPLCQSFLGL